MSLERKIIIALIEFSKYLLQKDIRLLKYMYQDILKNKTEKIISSDDLMNELWNLELKHDREAALSFIDNLIQIGRNDIVIIFRETIFNIYFNEFSFNIGDNDSKKPSEIDDVLIEKLNINDPNFGYNSEETYKKDTSITDESLFEYEPDILKKKI